MNCADRIAEAHDISDLFALLSEFITALHQARDIYRLPTHLRPIGIDNADELSHWLRLAFDEIERMDAAQEEVPEVMLWFHAVLETATQKVRSFV